MLTRFDDYLIHQTADPVAHPVTGDRNFYDRYFFNGYDRDGELFFAVALGLYPNRRVMDASVSVVHDGVQHSIHASRLAPLERGESRVGPISVEVAEPMRRFRLKLAANESGIQADILFCARAEAIEEPRFHRSHEGRVVMDLTRLTQFGSWEGTIVLEGRSHALSRARHVGCRDRSWGIRPVGERDAGAPGPLPQYFWLWAPTQFDDCCAHFDVNESGDGSRWHAFGSVMPALAPDAPTDIPLPALPPEMASVTHAIAWQPGTRRAKSARITLTAMDGETHELSLEPILSFQMLGLGYLHPDWGHGLWKGEQALAAERWRLEDCPPMDLRYIHVQQLCRVRMGARTGVGVLEQLVIGPHGPSGFKSLLDPAT
jgi:hypothetical protein